MLPDSTSGRSALGHTDRAQPFSPALQVALVASLAAWHIHLAAVVGHSRSFEASELGIHRDVRLTGGICSGEVAATYRWHSGPQRRYRYGMPSRIWASAKPSSQALVVQKWNLTPKLGWNSPTRTAMPVSRYRVISLRWRNRSQPFGGRTAQLPFESYLCPWIIIHVSDRLSKHMVLQND